MSQKQQNLNMIRLPEVCEKVALSKPSIYRMMKTGDFPKAHKLGARAVGWTVSSIEQWLASKVST